MIKEAFTLKKYDKTGELHLFKGSFSDDGCTSAHKAICKQVDKDDIGGNIFTCLAEEEARKRCAALGRKICGVCISDLYLTK